MEMHEAPDSAGGSNAIETGIAMCPVAEDFLELTARGVLRVFVPMRDWRVRRRGSQLYPALKWKRKVHRAALRGWITVGGARFTHRVSTKDKGEWALGDLLRSAMPALSTVAVSIGPPSPGQKITAQLMDGRGRILGFAKYADRPLTRTRLANEARMLETLPESVRPRLISFTQFMEGDLLVQTPLPGRSREPRLRLDTAQIRFLERLVRPENAYAASAHPFVETLRSQAGGYEKALESILSELDGREWPLAYMHGDLAPWNMRWWRGDCLAFDWECGWENGFAYLDAAYTLIQVASLVRGIEPRTARGIVADRLRDGLPGEYAKFASAITALSGLYTLVSWYPPHEQPLRKPSAQEDWLRTFVETPS